MVKLLLNPVSIIDLLFNKTAFEALDGLEVFTSQKVVAVAVFHF